MNTQHGQHLSNMVARYRRPLVRIAFALVVVGLLASGLWVGRDNSTGSTGVPVTVVVEQGDTLWDLALRYGPPGTDARKTVCETRRANHLAASLIHPGDVLRIPQ